MTDKIEGFLQVGTNDQGEVVINHPDLKPDENGVGHIVFSARQARNLADLLNRKASEAEIEFSRKADEERYRAAAQIPVDRSAQILSDGSPVTEDHSEINPATGQQKGYIVLSASERAKGFVRPVRRSYRHVGVRPRYPLRDLTEEEKARHVGQNYVKFEVYPESESPKVGRYWTEEQLRRGCQTVTTMGLSIAETYARDPKFYGGTFCCGCGVHLPLEEFVWEGTMERVGS